jgi:hypothetical protein
LPQYLARIDGNLAAGMVELANSDLFHRFEFYQDSEAAARVPCPEADC